MPDTRERVKIKVKLECEESFLELLQSGMELDCGLIIGDADMPADLVWDGEIGISEYGQELFRPVLVAPYRWLENGALEVLCSDWKLGERFSLAAAGYIGEKEYHRIFQLQE